MIRSTLRASQSRAELDSSNAAVRDALRSNFGLANSKLSWSASASLSDAAPVEGNWRLQLGGMTS